jgi:indoleacetamide hydrolase
MKTSNCFNRTPILSALRTTFYALAITGMSLVWISTPASAATFVDTASEPFGTLAAPHDPATELAIETRSPESIRRFAANLTASEALAAMDFGLLTSADYVDALIERILAHPEINAFIHLDTEGARAAAAEADALRAHGEGGPLLGLPILLKDSINTADMPTTAGTPTLDGFIPASSAPVAQILTHAGAIVLGKTNLHELSLGYTTNNAFTGPTRNPYDTDRIPGGSSGGNGAALAARFAPLAIGEDTAGSIRVPAALTGTMGFRPSTGRYSAAGVVPLASTFDTLGPMARSVRDLALADAVITGGPIELETVSLQGLRIGVPRAHFHDLIDPAVEQAFAQALARLEHAGATLVAADLPGAGELSVQASTVIIIFEAPVVLAAYLDEHDTGVTLEQLVAMIASPDVRALFEIFLSGVVTEEQYLQVQNQLLPVLQQLYRDYFDNYDLDVMVYPSEPLPAPLIGQETVMLNGMAVPVGDAFLHNAHYTPVIGAPTLTLPIGQGPRGLPLGGIDVAGMPGDDRRVLAIGDAISRLLPRIRPPTGTQPLPQRGPLQTTINPNN